MKVGDIVMFIDEGSYKDHFYGKIGEVIRSRENKRGIEYVNVSWSRPVKYFESYTKNSSFPATSFKLMVEASEAS